jgi:CRISPR-associated protein Csb2
MSCLLVSLHFHDRRYHGRPEWPPSPARLFQALVAGAAQGERLTEEDRRALAWLELLGPPVIAAPAMRPGQSVKNFVPNNDLDAVGGDPGRVSEIRAPKLIKPVLFDGTTPLLYAWTFDDTAETEADARRVCAIANHLYQLGRGVDMAWAQSETLDAEEIETRLIANGGAVYRPCTGDGGTILAVPTRGSLTSLIERHEKMRTRFQTLYELRPTRREPERRLATGQIFVQPPKPRFRQLAYDSPPVRLLFDILGAQAAWPLARIVELLTCVRDAAARRLKDKLPSKADEIHNIIVGRSDASKADKVSRVRITPLPSIGHQYADHAIRRILVEIPPNCPLRADDVEWAFSGLEAIESKVDSTTGEVHDQLILASASDRTMLRHYGVDDKPSRVWHTVTPAALPEQAARRRIDPARRREEAKGGDERAKEECQAAAAVIQSLRHTGLNAGPHAVRVQREPFEAKGARAEAFAPGTRFAKERLWHTEITFAEAVPGPLVIGDGRYLGLGLMAPPTRDAWRDVIVFSLPPDSGVTVADRHDLLHAVRRALMSLSRDYLNGRVTRLFSGHENDGGPAASGKHEHIFLAADDSNQDGRIDRIIVAAPWACDRSMRPRRDMQSDFDEVVSGLTTIRAGRLGVITLAQPVLSDDDPLIRPTCIWESRTPYHATRHAGRRKDPGAALVNDVVAECVRRRLPQPKVKLIDFFALPSGGGLAARMRLHFATAIQGPLLLGRDSHKGGGLFSAVRE